MPEATYDHTAPSSYHETEAHYDPAHSNEVHYGSSTTTRTHCTHHSERGTHCVGNSLRATHPALGTPGREGNLLMGTINEEGTEAYWREQADHCNPLVETQLGRPLTCTRFAGKGDINASRHITTMERIRGCPRLECARRYPCRPDRRTRAVAGTLDTCTDGLECTYGSGADVCVCACARVRAFTLACLSGRHFSAADAGCGWLCRLRVRSPRQARRNLCRCRTRPRSHAHSQIAPGVSAVGAQFLNVSRSFLESLGSDVVDPLRRLTTRRAGSTRRDGLLGVGTSFWV